MLPADRAPAYPTQYAGEPTFLCLGKTFVYFRMTDFYCLASFVEIHSLTQDSEAEMTFIFHVLFQFIFVLDPNIDETGNQLYKSNNGPLGCCYEYCTRDDGLCSSTCDTIFISNQTAITPNNNPANLTQSKINLTPSLFIKLDDGSYVLNDYSSLPAESAMTCPVLPNITQSTQQCSISQAQAASSATSLYSRPLSSISVSIQQLITYLLTTYLHLYFPFDYIVALLKSRWMILVWNLLSLNVLRRIVLHLSIGL